MAPDDDLTPIPAMLPAPRDPKATQRELDRSSVQALGTKIATLEAKLDKEIAHVLDRQARLDQKLARVLKVAETALELAEDAARTWRRFKAAIIGDVR
jgi:hypothetical protein